MPPRTVYSAALDQTSNKDNMETRPARSRRFYDLIALHVSDMGGRANLSEAQLALIKRAATLEVELEAVGRKAEPRRTGGP
jgi:hypothetical protein